tara:strand:- start:679 stop:804 length:126 start_codon:yes stop_codon:yes gene_type:complete
MAINTTCAEDTTEARHHDKHPASGEMRQINLEVITASDQTT